MTLQDDVAEVLTKELERSDLDEGQQLKFLEKLGLIVTKIMGKDEPNPEDYAKMAKRFEIMGKVCERVSKGFRKAAYPTSSKIVH